MKDTENNGTTSSATAKALKEKAEKTSHRFKKGQSGNPAGRPAGSKNKLTLLREAVLMDAEELVLRDWTKLVKKTIELADQGDSTCMKILWDRIIPSKRAVDITHTGDKSLNVTINVSKLEAEVADGDIEIIDGEFEDA